MKQFLLFLSVVIFSIFVGSQITEGALLLPYWQSLSSQDFYDYYSKFGPTIGLFYTVFTITAAFIPVLISIYYLVKRKDALVLALISTFFAILVIASFYIYFKGTNELFYQSALSELELKNELIRWGYWHWGRIVIECLSLLFLVLSIIKISISKKNME